jgi:HME family heavy-metal exporter
LQALGVERERTGSGAADFGANTSGGFLEAQGREYLIRQIGRTSRIEDLQNLVVAVKNGQPILLKAGRRGEAGAGHQARRRRLQRQAGGDPLGAEAARRRQRGPDARGRKGPGRLGKPCRRGRAPQFLFKQADFIEHSVTNVEEALRDGAILVAVILFLFLLNVRTTSSR